MTEYETDFRTFSYLANAAHNALLTAEEHDIGSKYQDVSCVLFCAFTLEGVLNHIGDARLNSWFSLERHASPETKLSLLAELLDLTVDISRRPFQSFKQIFRFRNELVHPKSVVFTRKVSDDDHEADLPDSIKAVTHKFAQRMKLDTDQISQTLLSAAGFPETEYTLISSSEPTFGHPEDA